MKRSHRSPFTLPSVSRGEMLAAAAALAAGSLAVPGAAAVSSVPRTASLEPLLAAKTWLNGAPTRETLRGNVVLVDVFTFDCINCKNITPNLRRLAAAKPAGLTIVGIHSPETSYERDADQVVTHLAALGVTWPVAIDNDFALWKAYDIAYWPTQMLFDRRGTLRRVVIGDSQDATVDAAVTTLLREPA
jgi:thiol-disulfide isomerase/thioredoxin